jgi:hypothetical protein
MAGDVGEDRFQRPISEIMRPASEVPDTTPLGVAFDASGYSPPAGFVPVHVRRIPGTGARIESRAGPVPLGAGP